MLALPFATCAEFISLDRRTKLSMSVHCPMGKHLPLPVGHGHYRRHPRERNGVEKAGQCSRRGLSGEGLLG
jgi:hypothetical protein